MGKKNTKTSEAEEMNWQPAKTPEEQEQRMILLSMNLAEKQLREGTASSQVITHYLKLASSKERVEKEKMKEEIKLLKAKSKAIESAENIEKLYGDAISAMKEYSGNKTEENYE